MRLDPEPLHANRFVVHDLRMAAADTAEVGDSPTAKTLGAVACLLEIQDKSGGAFDLRAHPELLAFITHWVPEKEITL